MGSQLTDIAVLAQLVNLKTLNLEYNHIQDIAPLTGAHHPTRNL